MTAGFHVIKIKANGLTGGKLPSLFSVKSHFKSTDRRSVFTMPARVWDKLG